MDFLEKLKDGLSTELIISQRQNKSQKCEISNKESILSMKFPNDIFEIDLQKSFIVIERLYSDSLFLEILSNNISYFLIPKTISEREEWYHALLTLKYPHLRCLNLHPLHKWVRMKRGSIAKDSFCVSCDKLITSKSLSFVVCDICGICVHDRHLSFIKFSCKWTNKDCMPTDVDVRNAHQWIKKYESYTKCFHCDNPSYPESSCAKCIWCSISKHIKCVPTTTACMGQDKSDLVLSPSLIKLKNAHIKLNQIEENFWPLFVFVNIRGGKCQGVQFARALRGLLNPIQVWDIPVYSIESGLIAIKNIPRFRLLICGGDGTIGWVMSEIDKVGISPSKIKIAVLPLGTGNDFSRVFGWGPSFDDTSKLAARLKWMFHSVTVPFDRWEVSIRTLIVGNKEDSKADEPRDLYNPITDFVDVANLIFCYLVKIPLSNNIKESNDNLSAIYQQTINLIRKGYVLIKDGKKANVSEYIDYVKFEYHLKQLERFVSIFSRELECQDSWKFKKNNKSFFPCNSNDNERHQQTTDETVALNIPIKLSSSYNFIDKTIWFESDMKNDKHCFINYTLESIKISTQKMVQILQFKKADINKLVIDEYKPNLELIDCDICSFNRKNTLISKRYLTEDYLKPTIFSDSIKTGSTYSVTMNNYFGVGLDAKIALDFHNKRELSPKNFESRAMNKIYYGYLGGKEFMAKSCKNLQTQILLECDGIPIKLPPVQAVVVLNIPSYMSGVNFWGSYCGGFGPQEYSDGLLEVTVISGVDQMCISRLIGGKRENRVAQCQKIKITILDSVLPIQVDGEAQLMGPCVINISHKNTYFIMKKCKNFESYAMVKVNPDLVVKFLTAPFSILLHVTEFFIIKLESTLNDFYKIFPIVSVQIEKLNYIKKQFEEERKEFDDKSEMVNLLFRRVTRISDFVHSTFIFYYKHKFHMKIMSLKQTDTAVIKDLINVLKNAVSCLSRMFYVLKKMKD